MGAADGIHIGTAGWQIPRAVRDRFRREGSTLQRYAARFDVAEINSTFYRPHRPTTFARWAETTPDGFRFAVKAPRAITHERRLTDGDALIRDFAAQLAPLGAKLGPVLVQLPPSLAFDAETAARFLAAMGDVFDGQVVCEPRHPTWFEAGADALLAERRVVRVAADPAPVTAGAEPGGWRGFTYRRLHGSPRVYWSAYGGEALDALAAASRPGDWIVFDNTASGAAAADALALSERLATSSPAAGSPASSTGP